MMVTHRFSSHGSGMKSYACSGNHKAVIIHMNKCGVDFSISVARIVIFLFPSKLWFQE